MSTSRSKSSSTSQRSRAKPDSERKSQAMVFRFRAADTRFGVSRTTTARLAEHLGLTETEVIHFAVAQLAREQLPAYVADDGALTKAQLERIKKLEPQGRMKPDSSLF